MKKNCPKDIYLREQISDGCVAEGYMMTAFNWGIHCTILQVVRVFVTYFGVVAARDGRWSRLLLHGSHESGESTLVCLSSRYGRAWHQGDCKVYGMEGGQQHGKTFGT